VDIECRFHGKIPADSVENSNPVEGIYVISNWANLKMYVGQSQNVARRLETHRRELILNRHDKVMLQKDWNTYGSEYFCFELLDLKRGASSLDALEAKWIRLYGTNEPHNGYNLGTGYTPKPPLRRQREKLQGPKARPKKPVPPPPPSTKLIPSPQHRKKLRHPEAPPKKPVPPPPLSTKPIPSPQHREKLRHPEAPPKKPVQPLPTKTDEGASITVWLWVIALGALLLWLFV